MNEHGFFNAFVGVPKIRLGDPGHNKDVIFKMWQEAESKSADLLALPELCITGSTCGDMFKNDELLHSASSVLMELSAVKTVTIPLFVGVPIKYNGKIYNCTAVIAQGLLRGLFTKDEVDESVFSRWEGENVSVRFYGHNVPMGHDICLTVNGYKLFAADPTYESVKQKVDSGATAVVIPGSVPGYDGLQEAYLNRIKSYSQDLSTAIICPNAGVGESVTDNVYTGKSFIIERGKVEVQTPDFETGIYPASLDVDEKVSAYDTPSEPYVTTKTTNKLFKTFNPHPFIPENYGPEYVKSVISRQGYALASRMERVGSKKVVLGLSGGLDSAWALIAAVEAMRVLGEVPKDVLCISMPCFGTSKRTKSNSQLLAEAMCADFREIDISESVKRHLQDIGHPLNDHSVAFENAQARERTQVLMDIANDVKGIVLGTGDLSEEALGWCTYNGDHMSMYNVNASVPKTLMRVMTRTFAESICTDPELTKILLDIVDTPVSPELLPTKDGKIVQKTEENVGPYELNDFFLYHTIKNRYGKTKLLGIASMTTFDKKYTLREIYDTLDGFYKRFTASQFKRNCSPDGPQITEISLSPRGGLNMPSDMYGSVF